MATLPTVHVWTMRVDRLDEAAAAMWLPMLDESERRRVARFVFPRHRVQFVAAHALLRVALGRLCGPPPAAWRFVADARGKPSAWLAEAPAPVSFNLSHTEGMVGLAASRGAGRALGFDLEPLARKVDLAVADRFFSAREVAWLGSLAQAARAEGFLRLWTLKEAFIKATGKGLTQDLAAFSFAPCPPRIHFAAGLAEREADWWFEQRLLAGGFVAALGLRRPACAPVATQWTTIDPAELGIQKN
ncbi:MAG TPA: 4'-phosphopantetheinyl transferase superfamily protein [Stellaceae bacterium]|nr:4'-phosphopantetheinyl transferase superfamily protein [Stellaceae bacterium]